MKYGIAIFGEIGKEQIITSRYFGFSFKDANDIVRQLNDFWKEEICLSDKTAYKILKITEVQSEIFEDSQIKFSAIVTA